MYAIEKRFRTNTPKSAEIGRRTERVMPGGDTRTVAYHEPYPLTIARGAGSFMWDADGNRYVDLLANYTSLVHGHAYPPISEAIGRAARSGTAWAARSEAQVKLAEILCERIASVERVRFCNSGSEAGMLAAQVARHLTGRKFLLMARRGYHGSYDDLELGSAEHEGERTLLADLGDAGGFESSATLQHGNLMAQRDRFEHHRGAGSGFASGHRDRSAGRRRHAGRLSPDQRNHQ